jgi:hypothetical protein
MAEPEGPDDPTEPDEKWHVVQVALKSTDHQRFLDAAAASGLKPSTYGRTILLAYLNQSAG